MVIGKTTKRHFISWENYSTKGREYASGRRLKGSILN